MRKEYIIFLLSLIAIISFAIPSTPFEANAVWIMVALSVAAGLLILANKENDKNIRLIYLRPSYLFVLSYLIVFYQRPIDYVLGYVSDYIQLGEIQYMLQSLQYALTGLCMLGIGYLFEARKNTKRNQKQYNVPIANPRFYAVLSSILIVMVVLLVPRNVLMGGYSNDMLTNATLYNYLASWSNTILIAYIVQFTSNAKQTNEFAGRSLMDYIKGFGWWQNINVVTYSLLILNVGDRGPLIVLAFSYYISYIIVSKKQLSRVKITTALCIAVIITSLLGDTKQYRDNNTIFERLTLVFKHKSNEPKGSFLPATAQLSGSYSCLPIAMQMVPNQEDFSYGSSIVGDFTSGIPFAGRFFNFAPSSSYSISKYALGDNFTFGLGTNCIAALYMDGGLFLITLGMLLFGIVLRKFEVSIFANTTSSFFVFCMAFYFLIHVVYIPRSTLLSPFKYALWMYVVMTLYMHISTRKRK